MVFMITFSLTYLVICINNSMSASGYWLEVKTLSLYPGPWFSTIYFSFLMIFHLCLKDQFSLPHQAHFLHKAGTRTLQKGQHLLTGWVRGQPGDEWMHVEQGNKPAPQSCNLPLKWNAYQACGVSAACTLSHRRSWIKEGSVLLTDASMHKGHFL